MKPPITVDFETHAIERRPAYPPKPVGVSVKMPGERRSFYYRWGHPTCNNVSEEQGYAFVRDVFREASSQSGHPLLFQHAKFDVDVAEAFCQAPRVPWEKIHDTMYLIALHDPHAFTFSLKPSAERLLGMKPEERDLVKNWILKNVPEAKKKKKEWGRYIWRAPGDLVGRYADGDVIRTERLFNFLAPKIAKTGMTEAYDRERELMPILLDTEREGIRCDVTRLRKDLSKYEHALEQCDRWLRRALKTPDLDLDKDEKVGEALDRAGVVTKWVMTKTGKRSVAKKNMTLGMFEDKKIAGVYGYRVRVATSIRMFMRTWLEMSESSGRIYTNWNQVRQTHDGGSNAGARTGRLSSNPNFQNIPTDWYEKGDGYAHPDFALFPGYFLPELPVMRRYLLPEEGHVWIKRDYSQQEIRILAHFEDGSLLAKYLANPDYDLHKDVQNAIKEFAGIDLPRGPVKILNFGDIYGMGFNSFHEKTGISKTDYDRIKAAKAELLPDLEELDADIKARGRAGKPIKTWGGRLYFCEDATFSKKYKRLMSFEYKLLNYLIQGSAADCTKQAVINYHKHPKRKAKFLLTVHDEVNSSAPKERAGKELGILEEAMSNVNFSLPMKSDPSSGPNWGKVSEKNAINLIHIRIPGDPRR